jgi:hypothetical protein
MLIDFLKNNILGTYGVWRSDCYFQFNGIDFIKKENNLSLEEVYVESIVNYLK